MFLKQAELYWGLSHEFVKEVMDSAEKIECSEGDILFKEGDLAKFFFTMLKGRVRLSFGNTGQTVHVINHAGESFGWSSLVDRDAYSATAKCVEPTMLIKTDRKVFDRLLKNYPDDGRRFYKHLSAILGNRLIQSYKVKSMASSAENFPSMGTRQIEDNMEAVE